MDLAKTLIRCVARAFYETKHILAVDALLIHSALRDDDLAHLLGLQTKELRKLCAKLEEHRLLAVHNRQEIREGMQRPISRTYYYIDFQQTIDAVKYRIYRVTKDVEGMIRPTDERKDYFCPRCKSRWTQMEVLDNPGIDGFDCHKCGASLERDSDTADTKGGHEIQSKLMKQLEPLLVLLPRIDEAIIPENTFETAFNTAIPVQRNQLTNPIAAMAPIGHSSGSLSNAAKGVTQASIQRIEVDVTLNEERTAAQQAADVERKARLAEQNALPVWHTNSTVSGEMTALGSKEDAARRERGQLVGARADEEEEKKATEAAEMTDEVAQYYAQLARDRQQAKEDDDDDDDDDEGEFEDVPAPPTISQKTRTGGTADYIVKPLPNDRPVMSGGGGSSSGSGVPSLSRSASSNLTNSATVASTPFSSQPLDIASDDGRSPEKRRRIDLDENGYEEGGVSAAIASDDRRSPGKRRKIDPDNNGLREGGVSAAILSSTPPPPPPTTTKTTAMAKAVIQATDPKGGNVGQDHDDNDDNDDDDDDHDDDEDGVEFEDV